MHVQKGDSRPKQKKGQYDVSIHSRPIRRLTPQPTDRGRADGPSLKGEVSNHKGIFDEKEPRTMDRSHQGTQGEKPRPATALKIWCGHLMFRGSRVSLPFRLTSKSLSGERGPCPNKTEREYRRRKGLEKTYPRGQLIKKGQHAPGGKRAGSGIPRVRQRSEFHLSAYPETVYTDAVRILFQCRIAHDENGSPLHTRGGRSGGNSDINVFREPSDSFRR